MASGGEIRYARCAGGIDVAYKVMGDGPVDVVYVPGFVSHLDLIDDVPLYCRPLDDIARSRGWSRSTSAAPDFPIDRSASAVSPTEWTISER